jgi:hypothetical protein
LREKNRGRRDSTEAVLQPKMKKRSPRKRVRIKERAVSKILRRTDFKRSRKRRRRDNQSLRNQKKMSNTMEENPEKRRRRRSLKRELSL